MSKIKKYMPGVLSGVMSLTILCSGVGVSAYSAGAESSQSLSEPTNASETETVKTSAYECKKLCKEETVYVIADANGKAKKVIVSDWIKNSAESDKINDVSNLDNIQNLKGDETYVMNKNNMCVWNADGNDIYYQGTADEELPVELKVSYKLDGKTVAAEQLAGKSGKITMRFDYDNKEYETVKIEGKDEKIYVPFVMLTGMILDNDNFRNVEVSNGKVVNDGDRTYVAGFAFPKIGESLAIDEETLEIPDYVEITADVEDFELSTTLTLAANDMFSDIDFTDADDTVNGISDSLGEMTNAVNQLIDGSSALYEGLNTLLEKSGDLIAGVEQLTAGAQQLKDGAASLDGGADSLNDGASSLDSGVLELRNYIASLSGGLSAISSNSSSLNLGAEQVFNTLLSTADTQIAAAGITADKLTINNYSAVLDGITESLNDENAYKIAYNTALATVSSTVKSQEEIIKSAVEATVREQVLEGVLSAAGLSMSSDDYDTAVAAGRISEEVQAQISAAVSTQMSSGDIKSVISDNTEEQIQALIEENMQSDEVQSQINAGVEQAKAGVRSISALKKQLDSYNQFYQGVLSYTAGVDAANAGAQEILSGTYALKEGSGALKDGADSLKSGTGALLDGSITLLDGTNTLKDGSSALVDGVGQLKDGSMSLSKGLKQFKDEGVQVLVDAVDGDIKGLVNRLKAVSQVSANYKSYSGISDDMDGNTSFIYKTDSIEK